MSRQLTVNHLKKLQLEDIQVRKQEILTEIGLQKDVIVYSAKRMVSPFSPSNSGGGFKKMSTGIAIFDGVLVGYKIIKKIRGLFKRK